MFKSIVFTTTSVVSFLIATNVHGADLVRYRLMKTNNTPKTFSFPPKVNVEPTENVFSETKIHKPHIGPLSSNFAWQGFYVGAELGKSISQFHNAVARSATDNKGDQHFINSTYGEPSGTTGGVYAGYNADIGHNIIAGIDVDANMSGVKADVANSDNEVLATYKEGYTGGIRGRLGYNCGRILPYVAGGASVLQIKAAKGDIKKDKMNGVPIKEKMAIGYNVGGGFDYAVTNHVLVRADYRYQDIKAPAVQSIKNGHPVDDSAKDLNLKSHNVRIGVAYKF